jgi:hypothetical protein
MTPRLQGGRGKPLSNQFANFAVDGQTMRADSASSRASTAATSVSGGMGMLPSVPAHHRSKLQVPQVW